MAPLKLYNTLGRKPEDFKPIADKQVGLYSCGPTVYSRAHLGNLRAYIFVDILKRVLARNGYAVKHVMNITDVGHLTGDVDEGEDKIERAAQAQQRSAWDITKEYTELFKSDMAALNILEPNQWIKATDTIDEQIALVKLLEDKGYTYTIDDGVYFDTSKVSDYGKLAGGISSDELKAGARIEMNPHKRNATDFALWKRSPKDSKRQMEWNSPWGKGFPGWHLECSVMSRMGLGQPFDIHTGGVDHIRVHHTNEIAQSEAAYAAPLANYWLHNEFLVESGSDKVSKSQGTALTLDLLKEKGIDPLAYRYFCLGTHYRKPLNFSWEALEAATIALNRLRDRFSELLQDSGKVSEDYDGEFRAALSDDLNTPQGLALLWKLIDDERISDADKRATLSAWDDVLGLDLASWKPAMIPEVVQALAAQREAARSAKDWKLADELRDQVLAQGFAIDDTEQGPRIRKA